MSEDTSTMIVVKYGPNGSYVLELISVKLVYFITSSQYSLLSNICELQLTQSILCIVGFLHNTLVLYAEWEMFNLSGSCPSWCVYEFCHNDVSMSSDVGMCTCLRMSLHLSISCRVTLCQFSPTTRN